MLSPENGPVRVNVLTEADKLPDPPPVFDKDSQPRDLLKLDEDELREAEPDIIDSIWNADKRSKQQVGKINVGRLVVPQYEYKGGSWETRKHTRTPHQHWGTEDWETVEDCTEREGSTVMGPYNYRVRGLMPEAFQQAETKSSRPVLGPGGMKTGTQRDANTYNAMILWLATVPEDRTKPGGWDDPRMIEKFAVGNGIEVIKELLFTGEVLQAIAVILHLSRFSRQAEELMGNLSE